MKRHTASRSVEVEQNEVNERKKARIGGSQNDKSASPQKSSQDDVSKTNGEFVAEMSAAEHTAIKTSTPVVQNGVVGSLAPTFSHHSSASPEKSPSSEKNDAKDVDTSGDKSADDTSGTECSQSSELMDTTKDASDAPAPSVVNGEPAAVEDVSEKISVDDTEQVSKEEAVLKEETCTKEIKLSNAPASTFEPEYFLSSLLQTSEFEGHAEFVTSVAADGEVILSASRDTTMKMWDPRTKKEIHNFQGHSGTVNAIILLSSEQSAAFCKKVEIAGVSKVAISGSSDCSIRVWSVDSGCELLFLYTYNGITCLGYFEDSHFVVVGTDGGKLEVWDLSELKPVHSLLAHEEAITDLKVAQHVVSSIHSKVAVPDPDFGQYQDLSDIAWHAVPPVIKMVDGCYVYTSSGDGKVKVWLFEENELQVLYTRSRKEAAQDGSGMKPCRWNCLAAHDGLMYLGDNTSSLKVLDWRAGKLHMLKNQDGCISAVTAKKNVLLSSSFDARSGKGAINVWNLPGMSYVCTMSGDVGKVSSLAITETCDGIIRIVSGGTKLLVWDFVLNQKSAEKGDDKYFCVELENFGDDEKMDSNSSSSSDDDHPAVKPSSSKCIIL